MISDTYTGSPDSVGADQPVVPALDLSKPGELAGGDWTHGVAVLDCTEIGSLQVIEVPVGPARASWMRCREGPLR